MHVDTLDGTCASKGSEEPEEIVILCHVCPVPDKPMVSVDVKQHFIMCVLNGRDCCCCALGNSCSLTCVLNGRACCCCLHNSSMETEVCGVTHDDSVLFR